jgi:hypothetical protein
MPLSDRSAVEKMTLAGMGRFRGSRSFDILDWSGTLSGQFSPLQLRMFGGQFTWDASQLYTTGVLTLSGPPPEADFNHNGVVDAADYVVWRNIGGPQSDYELWREQFGITYNIGTGSSSGPTSSAAVPEPTTLVMLFMGMLSMFFRRSAAVS